ncbi:lysylphosphatidylglycerol synthase domain-containing protein [Brachybacterium sp. AOP43-C2-M15]|uniref:lysylphosphatidylglycerol synthase domain-containing protein n=1 Tax=Brachybacterium sp. AOP43-C2-M15 TaxID=3457661 RepID=UPI004033177E
MSEAPDGSPASPDHASGPRRGAPGPADHRPGEHGAGGLDRAGHRATPSDASLPEGVGWLPEDLAELGAEAPPRLSPGRITAGILSAGLVVALLAWALPWATGASWTQIGGTLGALPPWSLPAMVLLGLGALLLESVTVRAALPGSRWRSALLGHTASGATALAVPGGSVLGLGLMAWILRRAGLALPLILTGIVAASLVEMVITSVLVPLLGLSSYALSASLAPTGVTLPGALWAALLALVGAVIALALTAVLLRRPVLSGLLTQFGGAVPDHVARGILVQRDALVDMLRRRPVPLVLPTLGARVLQWAALVLAVQAVGAEVPLLLTIAIFALGRVLSLVPLTPGGAGITETVGAAALVALGVSSPDAAAAMLLLMVAMLLVPLLVGALSAVVSLSARPTAR